MGATKRSRGKTGDIGAALDFMRVLWALDHALRSTSKGMSQRLGVTGPQRVVLRLVGRTPGIAAGELAVALHIDPSTLTGILKRLVKRKLISKKSDPNDKRRAVLELTSRGQELDQVHAGTVEAAVVRLLDNQPAARVRAVRDMLAALVDELASESAAKSSGRRAPMSEP